MRRGGKERCRSSGEAEGRWGGWKGVRKVVGDKGEGVGKLVLLPFRCHPT